MIKKYVMLISAILVIIMFTSTSTASFLFSEEKIYEQLPENSPLRKILDRFSQIASDRKDSVSIDINDEYYDGNDDEDDGEYDDGEHDADNLDEGPIENILLPNVLEEGFYWTPDGGNEPVDNLEETTTIDIDGEVGATQDEVTVDSDGDDEATGNEITIDESEWTVDEGTTTVKLERVIKIVTELNGKLGAMLQRVIERTVATDEAGISSPGSGGSAENNIVDNIVLTAND